MQTLLFKPSLYTDEDDFLIYSVTVSGNFWKAENLREQYEFAFQDKIEKSLDTSRPSREVLLDILAEKWQLGNMAIQINDDGNREIAYFLASESNLGARIISNFSERLTAASSEEELKKLYAENGREYPWLAEPPFDVSDIDFEELSMFVFEKFD